MSIYIHIPFCNSICSYCDFCKVYYNKKYIYDYLDNLKKENFNIIGIEQTSSSQLITDFEINSEKKYALILGNEVDGISDEALENIETFLEIPQLGTKHSLNVSVCGGVVIWEFAKNLGIKK